jgi:hypothetical protein
MTSQITERPLGFARMIERAAGGAGAHPHMLRHACGYALSNKGHDTRAIQGWLGRLSITSTAACARAESVQGLLAVKTVKLPQPPPRLTAVEFNAALEEAVHCAGRTSSAWRTGRQLRLPSLRLHRIARSVNETWVSVDRQCVFVPHA